MAYRSPGTGADAAPPGDPSQHVVDLIIGWRGQGPALKDRMSARFRESITLADDDHHEFVPRLDERPGALVLEPSREEVDVDAGGGEAREDVLAVAAVQG